MPASIDESLIVDEVLGVQRGHCKGVGWIVKGKVKRPLALRPSHLGRNLKLSNNVVSTRDSVLSNAILRHLRR